MHRAVGMVACPSCGQRTAERIGAIYSTAGQKDAGGKSIDDEAALWRCRECFLLFRHPALPQEELNSFYVTGSRPGWSYQPALRTDWQTAKHLIHSVLGRGTVVDIGCFDGTFLAQLGSSYEKYGVEPNEKARSAAREKGIHILARDVEEFCSLGRQYDIIVAFDVVEHFADPLGLLVKLERSLAPRGLIILSSGNADALPWRLMKGRYWYCSLPDHVSFISPPWVRQAARKSNLTVISMTRISHAITRFRYLQVVAGFMMSAIYLISPHLIRMLRKIKKAVTAGRIAMDEFAPPVWRGVKDHLLVVCEKK
ncbi:MAG: class I SAM-dependent methyltransferase [Nitrospirota bacterium]|nr:class I SAM-dependent methyltransferase [Nitrospirota bacterium]